MFLYWFSIFIFSKKIKNIYINFHYLSWEIKFRKHERNVNQRGTLLVLFNQRETPNPKLTIVNELGPSQTLLDRLKKASSQLMLQARFVLVEESFVWLLAMRWAAELLARECWSDNIRLVLAGYIRFLSGLFDIRRILLILHVFGICIKYPFYYLYSKNYPDI